MKEGIKVFYYKLYNNSRILDFNTRFKFFNRTQYEIIKKNTKFKNIHAGQRCFILGNGPSLNTEDLTYLENEIVFTVNQISRHKDFSKIKTNYHFWADPVFFDLSEDRKEDMELLNVYRSLSTIDNNPECFFPLDSKSFVEKFKLNEILNINYFKSELVLHEEYKEEFHFDNLIPGFSTVIQWAIIMAVYMGFKEIYLLGCDTTTIITKINSVLENGESQYAYEISENEKSRLAKSFNKHSMEVQFKTEASVLSGYRILKEFAVSKEIKIVNCSKTTIIDSVPRGNYEDIIGVKE